MNYKDILIKNLDNIHTTSLGITRIKNNINYEYDVVLYIKDIILDNNSYIYKQGKNYYILYKNIKITINSNSYTIITAHTIKEEK